MGLKLTFRPCVPHPSYVGCKLGSQKKEGEWGGEEEDGEEEEEEKEEEMQSELGHRSKKCQISPPCDSSPSLLLLIFRDIHSDAYLGVWLVEECFPDRAGLDRWTFVAAAQLLANELD